MQSTEEDRKVLFRFLKKSDGRAERFLRRKCFKLFTAHGNGGSVDFRSCTINWFGEVTKFLDKNRVTVQRLFDYYDELCRTASTNTAENGDNNGKKNEENDERRIFIERLRQGSAAAIRYVKKRCDQLTLNKNISIREATISWLDFVLTGIDRKRKAVQMVLTFYDEYCRETTDVASTSTIVPMTTTDSNELIRRMRKADGRVYSYLRKQCNKLIDEFLRSTSESLLFQHYGDVDAMMREVVIAATKPWFNESMTGIDLNGKLPSELLNYYEKYCAMKAESLCREMSPLIRACRDMPINDTAAEEYNVESVSGKFGHATRLLESLRTYLSENVTAPKILRRVVRNVLRGCEDPTTTTASGIPYCLTIRPFVPMDYVQSDDYSLIYDRISSQIKRYEKQFNCMNCAIDVALSEIGYTNNRYPSARLNYKSAPLYSNVSSFTSELINEFGSNDRFVSSQRSMPEWLYDETTTRHDVPEKIFHQHSGLDDSIFQLYRLFKGGFFCGNDAKKPYMEQLYVHAGTASYIIDELLSHEDKYYVLPWTCICSGAAHCRSNVNRDRHKRGWSTFQHAMHRYCLQTILARKQSSDDNDNKDYERLETLARRDFITESYQHDWNNDWLFDSPRYHAENTSETEREMSELVAKGERVHWGDVIESHSNMYDVVVKDKTWGTSGRPRTATNLAKYASFRVTEMKIHNVWKKMQGFVNFFKLHRHLIVVFRDAETRDAFKSNFTFTHGSGDRHYKASRIEIKPNWFATVKHNPIKTFDKLLYTIQYISSPNKRIFSPCDSLHRPSNDQPSVHKTFRWSGESSRFVGSAFDECIPLGASASSCSSGSGVTSYDCIRYEVYSTLKQRRRAANDKWFDAFLRRVIFHSPKHWESQHFYISKPVACHGTLLVTAMDERYLSESMSFFLNQDLNTSYSHSVKGLQYSLQSRNRDGEPVTDEKIVRLARLVVERVNTYQLIYDVYLSQREAIDRERPYLGARNPTADGLTIDFFKWQCGLKNIFTCMRGHRMLTPVGVGCFLLRKQMDAGTGMEVGRKNLWTGLGPSRTLQFAPFSDHAATSPPSKEFELFDDLSDMPLPSMLLKRGGPPRCDRDSSSTTVFARLARVFNEFGNGGGDDDESAAVLASRIRNALYPAAAAAAAVNE